MRLERTSLPRRLAAGLAVIVLAAGLIATGGPSLGTTVPGTNGLIAVQTTTGLVALDPSSGARSPLLGSTGSDQSPFVAPNAAKVAFFNSNNLYTADWPSGANRTLVTAITDGNYFDWSPDSTKIAARVTAGLAQIPAVAAGVPVPVTGADAADFEPTYSPDGQYIVATNGFNLVRINANNSGGRTVIPGSTNSNRRPQVSPNGSTLYFDRVTTGVWTLPFPAGGSEPALLNGSVNGDQHPFPSPDGTFVVVQAGAASTGLFRLNANGTGGRVAITGSLAGDMSPSWGGAASAPPPPAVNAAPVFSSGSACGGAALLRLIGAAPTPVSASDTAGQSVTLSASGLPTWAAFTSTPSNPATGNFSFALSFTNPLAFIDLVIALFTGTPANVTITATDNGTPVASATCAKTLRVALF